MWPGYYLVNSEKPFGDILAFCDVSCRVIEFFMPNSSLTGWLEHLFQLGRLVAGLVVLECVMPQPLGKLAVLSL